MTNNFFVAYEVFSSQKKEIITVKIQKEKYLPKLFPEGKQKEILEDISLISSERFKKT